MSTRTYYNLRTRTDTSTAETTRVQNRSDTGAAPPLYSAVAASRPPSPRGETSTPASPVEPITPADRPSEEVDSEGVFGYSKTDQVKIDCPRAGPEDRGPTSGN
jgi:hypothetical protein